HRLALGDIHEILLDRRGIVGRQFVAERLLDQIALSRGQLQERSVASHAVRRRPVPPELAVRRAVAGRLPLVVLIGWVGLLIRVLPRLVLARLLSRLLSGLLTRLLTGLLSRLLARLLA